jgi:hypothetical protein
MRPFVALAALLIVLTACSGSDEPATTPAAQTRTDSADGEPPALAAAVRSLRVDSGDPALIELGAVPLDRVILDPANPGAYSNPKTADFPSSVYFPEAGCYAFEARWPGGSWRAVLAVGAPN